MPTGMLGDQTVTTEIARKYYAITAAMGTTAQVIQTGPAGLYKVINSGAAQTGTVNVYDATTGDTLSAANLVWSGVLTAGTIIALNIQTTRGITAQMSTAAAGANILVTFA